MSELNLPLARKVLEHIEAHPEEHFQGFWGKQIVDSETACRTTMCIAGWAAALSGCELEWENGFLDKVNGDHNVHGYAEELLGLNSTESVHLFYSGNQGSIGFLKELIEGAENA